jgi:hypothetical protein
MDRFSHSLTADDPQAYARGYNPVPSGRGFGNLRSGNDIAETVH